GLSDEDEDKKLERMKQELESGVKTVAMVWAENDVDVEDLMKENGGKLPSWAYAPANPQLIQVFMNQVQTEQQAEQAQQQQAQGEQDRANQEKDGEIGHQRQLEVMDKQHQQGLEAKKLDQEHQTK